KGFSPDDLVGYLQENDYLLGTMFIGNTIIRNSKYATVAIDYKTGKESEVNYHRYGIIPCVQCGLTKPMAYYPPASNNADKDSGCIGFWFYPTAQKYLLYIKGTNGQSSIGVYISSSNKLRLDLYSSDGILLRYETNSTVTLNKWNFFGLNFSYRYDGEAYGDMFSFELYLNGECKKGSLGLAIHTDNSFYHIGYRFDGNTGYDGLESYITALMIGTRREISSSQMEEYYNVTKDYIINALSINGTEVGFSIATTYEVSDVRLKQFEIYPLHNHYKSLNGKMPKAFDARKVSKKNKDRTFSYNNLISRYAYVADGCRLEYPVEQTTAGTILARAIIKEDSEKQYFFEYTDASYRKVGLYRGSDKYLYVEANDQTYKTSLLFTSNVWHTVGFSFYESITSTSISTTKKEPVRVYLDGQSVSFNITCVHYIPTSVSIGRQFNLNGDTYNPLLGQIEMLAIGKTYSEESTLNLLSNELKSTTKISKYNELGQLKKTIIRNRDTTILSTEYNYASTKSNHTSRYVGNELIQYNSNTIRSYDWDKQGNVIKIDDIVFGSHNYKYNERGFLEQEDSIIYKYDSNGNITNAGSTTFGYDETIKDRLTSVNGKAITYGSNPLNPTSYNGNTFTWEGRRLLKYNNIEYTYDEQGLRTRKKVNGSTTKYYYDRTNLITEVNPSYRLDFLYDAEDQLYGFIYNNSDKYYYVRDFMQNILGIIDSNGNLVVKYEYTAYGTITSITGSKATTIGAYNPFRYKGYYYDSETGLYLVTTRYYNPEWCRFISPDSIEYLDPNNINGMNLYAYCRNNPINYVDPDGHMPWWAALLIGGSIIVGLAVASVFTAGTVGAIVSGALAGSIINGALGFASGITLDENGWSFDWDKAATGFMCGTITGAISGAVSAGISNGFSFAGHAFEKGSYAIRGIKAGVDGLLAMGSYMAQSAINGSEISVVGSLISLGTGLLNFADPMGKIFDTIWIPTIGAEIAWGYDMISSAFKRKNQKLLAVY
ncbi:MAG: hypothetical protein K2F56_03865, partial [Anaeroplasmataceae bacterium]|nr:hypothetical protein [Anaeroplasmataceae bacterium]